MVVCLPVVPVETLPLSLSLSPGLGQSWRCGRLGCVLARAQSGGGELCFPAAVPPPAP